MTVPEFYQIESVEQLRAVSDGLRQRILEPLMRTPMTATQVADLLGEAASKIHYHVKELERVGLLHVVERREKGGILEKYYQAAGQTIVVSPTVLQSLSGEESVAMLAGSLETLSGEFLAALASRQDDLPAGLSLLRTTYWSTNEEHATLIKALQALIEPYETPREGARERVLAMVGYPAPGREEASREPKSRRVVAVGAVDYNRAGLQRLIDAGEVLDITVWGVCRFASDVSPDLVDSAVRRLHLHGRLQASPAVRDVLERKESPWQQP